MIRSDLLSQFVVWNCHCFFLSSSLLLMSHFICRALLSTYFQIFKIRVIIFWFRVMKISWNSVTKLLELFFYFFSLHKSIASYFDNILVTCRKCRNCQFFCNYSLRTQTLLIANTTEYIRKKSPPGGYDQFAPRVNSHGCNTFNAFLRFCTKFCHFICKNTQNFVGLTVFWPRTSTVTVFTNLPVFQLAWSSHKKEILPPLAL